MKHTYEIMVSLTGNIGSGVTMRIVAETEFEAIKEAQRRYPQYKIAYVKIIN